VFYDLSSVVDPYRVRIQGFDDKIFLKFYSYIPYCTVFIGYKKFQYIYPKACMKDVKATALQKRTSGTSTGTVTFCLSGTGTHYGSGPGKINERQLLLNIVWIRNRYGS
jgi:hypothetical protein